MPKVLSRASHQKKSTPYVVDLTIQLILATAGGERQGMTSNDEGVVDRVTAAIADAIVHRR
jgi:hypothetical protein